MGGGTTITLQGGDPVAVQLVLAIRGGDVGAVERLLADEPRLARARITDRGGSKTPLHVATDWPGYFPAGPQIVRLLIGAGADPDAVTTPEPGETPLHWAASSDDADVAAALIDGGADIEKPDGSIGTPLDNAIGYACWHVARLLAARGARVDKLWHAAALGMLARTEELLATEHGARDEISQAFWHACGAGQRRAAEYLLARGADLAWVPEYAQGTALDAAGGLGTRRENVITWLRELGAPTALGQKSRPRRTMTGWRFLRVWCWPAGGPRGWERPRRHWNGTGPRCCTGRSASWRARPLGRSLSCAPAARSCLTCRRARR